MGILEMIWRGGVLLFFGYLALSGFISKSWLGGIILLFIFVMFLLSTIDAWSMVEYNKKNKKK